jgi:deoxyribonuclease V
MKACCDVYYRGNVAVTGVLAFDQWEDASLVHERVEFSAVESDYEPGAFYKRELPCLLAAIRHVLPLELIIIDGYVWLGQERPGLGAKLYETLEGKAAVVGVAKTAFHGNDAAREVRRGRSARPLFVTCVGIGIEEACAGVVAMHGESRIPSLLARVDRLSRSKFAP